MKKCKKKPHWIYYHFIFVCHEWHSYDVWFLRYGVQQAKSFLILDHFTEKSKFWKKSLEISSAFTCVPQMTIIWCMVPEIWSTTGKTFSNFGTFFVLLLKSQNFEKKACKYHQLTLVYHKWQSYDVWFLRDKVQRTEFLGTIFCPFDLHKNLVNQNFDKMKQKKISGDIINCTINA